MIRFKCQLSLLLLFLLSSCAGTDLLDDPLIGEKIVIEKAQIALFKAQKSNLIAVYYDAYGIEKPVNLQYTSSNPNVAQINNAGEITAIATGSTVIRVSYQNIIAPLVNVNVVASNNDVAIVSISSTANSLKLGNKTQLNFLIKNINGEILPNRTIQWFSENINILEINTTGEVTAKGLGIAGIHAKVEGVKSNSIDFTVSDDRRGSFVSAGGYQAIGTAILKEENGKIILQLNNDFVTNFALGTYVYLANSTNGSNVRAGGLEIAEIKTNGAKTFIVSDLYPNIKLYDYRYVIILCKPASVTFGYADFN